MKTIKKRFIEMFGEADDDTKITNEVDGVYMQYTQKSYSQYSFEEPIIGGRLELSSFDDDMNYIMDDEKDYISTYPEIVTLIEKLKFSDKLNNNLKEKGFKTKKAKI
ncbi:hypothetical protein [Burkholderia cepacia]|uniref:hypothetical protein n=1 Tax=Burkholderia cepacia TaxID=292 RepID=UPI00158F3BF8|nr:hypothetical protein [Burkholderia cepacia]